MIFNTVDYGPLIPPLMVTLESSEFRQCFEVAIINDVIALEGTEDFMLRLTDPMLDGVIIVRSTTDVNIIDDDGT